MTNQADTLAGMVALVERHQLQPDNLREWRVVTMPDGPRILVRWQTLELIVRDRTDLALAQLIARERIAARQAVDLIVVTARAALGWGRGEPYVRCLACRVADAASRQHAPGSAACRDTRTERALEHAD